MQTNREKLFQRQKTDQNNLMSSWKTVNSKSVYQMTVEGYIKHKTINISILHVQFVQKKDFGIDCQMLRFGSPDHSI